MKKTASILMMLLSITMSFAQTELTDDDAEAKLLVNNDRLIVLDFYATWCGPCKRMEPIIKELEAKYKDKVDFYKVDVDKNKVDDALNVTAMPTYFFLKNSSNLEVVEGAMSKAEMEDLILKHMGGAVASSSSNTIDLDDFSQSNIDKYWDSSNSLNSLAWNAYENYSDIKILLKAIKAVERSIELDRNSHNTDTYAALLYKTGNYTKALKMAKESIDIAKTRGEDYQITTELIEKIIDEM